MLHIHALGPLSVDGLATRRRLALVAGEKRLALFLYLLLYGRGGFIRRDLLLPLLWPEADESRARSALRSLVREVRSAVGDGVVANEGDHTLGVDVTKVRCDVLGFEAACEAEDWEQAVELYRGRLLEGFGVPGAAGFEEWLESERARLAARALDACRALAAEARGRGAHDTAVRALRKALTISSYDERVVRELMEAMVGAGDRAGALVAYEELVARLKRELEVKPGAETVAVAEGVREGGDAKVTVRDAVVRSADDSPLLRTPVERISGSGRGKRIRVVTLLATTFVGLLAIVGAQQLLFNGTTAPALESNRVVVGLFESRAGDAELGHIARMTTDWIAQGLLEAGVVEVVPPSWAIQTSLAIAEQRSVSADPVRSLAGETGARVVVSGSVYQLGDSLFFQAQVTDASEARLLGAITPVAGSIGAPTSAIGTVRERVMTVLSRFVDDRIADPITTPKLVPGYEAYRAFTIGMEKHLAEKFSEAGPPLHRAFELDSTFVLALLWAAVNHTYLLEHATADSLLDVILRSPERLSRYHVAWAEYWKAHIAASRGDAVVAARELARMAPASEASFEWGMQAYWAMRPREALEAFGQVDPGWGALRGRLTGLYWMYRNRSYHALGDHGRELKEAARVSALYPNALEGPSLEALALAALGKTDELEDVLDEISTMEARFIGTWWTAGNVMTLTAQELRVHGYPQAAQRVFERALGWFESRPSADVKNLHHGLLDGLYRGQALYYAGRWVDAEHTFDTLLEEFPDAPQIQHVLWNAYLGASAARLGNREKALRVDEWLAGQEGYLWGYHRWGRARIAAVLGQHERAVQLLREAILQGFRWDFRWGGHLETDFESLRDYEPFQELIKVKG